MDKEQRTERVLTVALAATAIGLVGVLFFTQYLLSKNENRKVEPAPVVLEFLDRFVGTESIVEQEAIVEQYFSCVNTTTVNYEGASSDLQRLIVIFMQPNPKATGYRVCNVKENYIEFMLQDAEGNDLPCRIGLFYRLGAEGRISSYSITRLQPLSREDSEWNGAWR